MVLCVTHILNCVAVLLFIAYVADEKIKCMSQVRSVTLDTWLPEQVEFISGIAVYSCCNIWLSIGNTEMFFSINFGSFHFVFWSWNWPAFRWVVERHDGPKAVGEGYLFLSVFWSVVFMISSHYFWCRTGFKLSICFLWSTGHWQMHVLSYWGIGLNQAWEMWRQIHFGRQIYPNHISAQVKMIMWVWRTLFVPSMICCPHSWFQLFDFRQISSIQQITGTKAMSGPALFTGHWSSLGM
jgi:hypothetical protein